MSVLLDTNILISLMPVEREHSSLVHKTVRQLLTQGLILHIVPQNLYEFWTVCTRPVGPLNGLGFSTDEALQEINRVKEQFTLLADDQAIYPVWEQLVAEYRITGRRCFDARLVAAMKVHGLTEILTFNDRDFRQFSGISVIVPQG